MAEDLLSVLTEDHQELRQLLVEVEVLSGGECLRRNLTDQLIIELVRHAIAEESYLYPLCRARLPDGGRVAEEAYIEHRRIEQVLKGLETQDLADERFSLLLSWLIATMRPHIDDEEARVFPLLAEYVSEEELLTLGEKARRSKSEAPSRPGTSRPGVPLLHLFLESGAGLAERVRAYICGRDRPYPAPPPPADQA
jgi:hemerythrin-like domain-containing protein